MSAIRTLKAIFSNRKLIIELAKSDFRKQFVGSYFGIVWMFVQPIVTVLIYFFVFQLVFGSTAPVPGVPYVLWLIPGIVPWFFFSDALNSGTRCLFEYNYLVKKVVFQVEILPVVKVASNFIVHLIFVLIMIAVFLCYGWMPTLHWIQILYYSGAVFMLALSIVYITSAINAFFKDMSQIVGIMLQFGMWLTPIMWYVDQFADKSFYPFVSQVIKLNPMYYIVAGYRDTLLSNSWFWQRPMLTLYYWLFVAVMFFLGNKIFAKLRPHFSDVL